MKLESGAMKMELARHGKYLRAMSMYVKGKHFLGAAILLRRHGGNEFVVLHLMCQGIEIALKGLLLLKDYDVYSPKLRRIGHNLVRAADEARNCFGLHAMSPSIAEELQRLNSLYSQHMLRYGSVADIFFSPDSIQSQRVYRRMAAVIRLAERHLCRQAGEADSTNP